MTSDLVAEVEQLYTWLDQQIAAGIDPEKECKCCGNCCDFDTFDHRLYLTTPELLYFQAKQPPPLKEMTTGCCPYHQNGRCTVYTTRFAGCRIFGCTRSEDLHTHLSETALTKLKDMCQKYNIPYRYMDLKTALSSDSMTV